MVNHDDFHGPLSRFQFQAKLLLKGVEQRGALESAGVPEALHLVARPEAVGAGRPA